MPAAAATEASAALTKAAFTHVAHKRWSCTRGLHSQNNITLSTKSQHVM
jgi:hypothetical protein